MKCKLYTVTVFICLLFCFMYIYTNRIQDALPVPPPMINRSSLQDSMSGTSVQRLNDDTGSHISVFPHNAPGQAMVATNVQDTSPHSDSFKDGRYRSSTAPIYNSTINPDFLESEFRSRDDLKRLFQSYKTSRYMDIIHTKARLGNRMFQYAILVSSARRYGYRPVMSQLFLRNIFTFPDTGNITVLNAKIFKESRSGVYNSGIENLTTNSNWTLKGLFQSFKYHDNKLIESTFKFKSEVLEKAQDLIKSVTVKGRVNIGIHVRRGDMLRGGQEHAYGVANVTFINTAIDYMNKKFHNRTNFIVLSDGMRWCKDNIRAPNVHFVHISEGVDLALMTLCDHMIITSGTFGWWGGRLCGGHVVYFQNYIRPNSAFSKRVFPSDFYPTEWKGL